MSANEDELFGSGIQLDQNNDIVISSTGDVSASSGVEELSKDIAFQLQLRVRDEIGARNTKEARTRIRSIVREILLEEPRVDSVVNIETGVSGTDEVEVVMTVIAEDEQQQLITEV